jgi:hypothetical protein
LKILDPFPEVKQLVAACLAVDPAERPSAEYLETQIQHLLPSEQAAFGDTLEIKIRRKVELFVPVADTVNSPNKRPTMSTFTLAVVFHISLQLILTIKFGYQRV